MATETNIERDVDTDVSTNTNTDAPGSAAAQEKRLITPTLAICAVASLVVAAGLFRPATDTPPAPTTSPASEAAVQASKVDTGVARTEPIEIVSFAYNDVTVPVGAVVEVRNLDGARHTVTAVDATFSTPTISGPGAATFVAPRVPGTYPYFCALHPSMQGTLVVE